MSWQARPAWGRGHPVPSRKDHGTTTGATTLSALDTHQTMTTATAQTWTFTDFSVSFPEFSLELIITGSTPTITLPAGATIAADSSQTLSAMAAGTYLVEVVSFDNGTTYDVLVGQVS